jgi:hypothetical protein
MEAGQVRQWPPSHPPFVGFCGSSADVRRAPGDPAIRDGKDGAMPKNVIVEHRFWEKVYPDPSGHLLWMGALNRKGYGQWLETKAHRWIYEQLVGPIPEGLVLDHLCRVPACVTVDDLEPVTIAENIRRGMGLAAINARKISCFRGHAFDEANTYVTPDGRRQCRACRALASIRYRKAVA